MLGLRHHRGHDLRATFISLAQTDGALPHVLKAGTHGLPGASGDIMGQYTRIPYEAVCNEVAKLNASLRAGHVVAFPLAVAVGAKDGICHVAVTTSKKGSASSMIPSPFRVTPPGIEPGIAT